MSGSEREEKRKTREERRKIRLEKQKLLVLALKRLERHPDVVIDIGVRRGTPWLYDSFADTPFLLIDPQQDGERLLTSRPRNYIFINKAVGRSPGRMVLHEQSAMSTFLIRTALTATPIDREYEVDIVTLDDVISEHLPNARKIGLKIDTEGFELEVIAGLKKHVDRVDFIISETSVLNRFENSYNFSQLVSEGLRIYHC